MDDTVAFKGFFPETVSFLQRLKRNNRKAWFDSHKQEYEQFVLEPAQAFVATLGKLIRRERPGAIADPRVNRSLFRIYRDTRFSHDKTPYKTNLALFIWEGALSRMECPGFYFQLETDKLVLGAGLYMFSPKVLSSFRKAVVDPESGTRLRAIIKDIESIEDFKVEGRQYKRVPPGYDPEHPNARLLLHNGLYVALETRVPDELFTAKAADFCWQKYQPFIPLHEWLVSLVVRPFFSTL